MVPEAGLGAVVGHVRQEVVNCAAVARGFEAVDDLLGELGHAEGVRAGTGLLEPDADQEKPVLPRRAVGGLGRFHLVGALHDVAGRLVGRRLYLDAGAVPREVA